jgi:DNA-binding NarL/FixJ family response regulator
VIGRVVPEERRAAEECTALRRELLERDRRLEALVGRFLLEQEREGEADRRLRDAAFVAEQLTGREREILRLLTAGLTNRQIAARLHMSPGTVRNYLGRLFPKLDVADRTQAAVRAVELNLLEASEAPPESASVDRRGRGRVVVLSGRAAT